MLSVVCWKWEPEQGSKHLEKRALFSIAHINILRAMVERNLSIPHRFVCVTDNHRGLHSSIKFVHIDRHFYRHAELGGCYRRLKAFDEATAMVHFGPRFVSIDLDTVVTGSLDSILGFQEDFRIWEDQHRRFTPYCGSLWGMDAGARRCVWDSFNSDPEASIRKASKYQGTDQAHISACLYPNEVTWTMDDGIWNFNTEVRRCPSRVFRRGGKTITECNRKGSLPKGSRLVFFNGKFDPSQEHLWKHHPWIRDFWHE